MNKNIFVHHSTFPTQGCSLRAIRRFNRTLIIGALNVLPALVSAWTTPTPVELSTTTALRYDTVLSAAAGAGQDRGVVWASDGETTDIQNGVFFSRSTNSGASWSPSSELSGVSALPAGSWGSKPCLSTDLNQTWVITWDACQVTGSLISGDRDIRFRRSTDSGQNWSPATVLNSNFADPLARNYNASVCNNKLGTWVAAWETELDPTPGGLPHYRISVARSTDNASNWLPVQFLDPDTSRTFNQNPHAVTDGQGTWIVAWDSTGTSDTDIRYCRSLDNGNTWSPGQWLNTNAASDDTTVGMYDGNVRLAANPSGAWVAVWTSSYDAVSSQPVKDRIMYARSTNEGATWSTPTPVDPSIASLPIRQMADIVWSGTEFRLMWAGPAGLEFSSSPDDGLTWTAPVTVASASSYPGGSESRPRLTEGASGFRIGAWIYRPWGSPNPSIISSQDSVQSHVPEWTLYW